MPAEQREIWDARLTRFDKVMDEDYENLAPIQRSMETAAHGGQVINYQERRIWHVQAWIDKVIGPERIPEHLRVPDLLADWVEHPCLESGRSSHPVIWAQRDSSCPAARPDANGEIPPRWSCVRFGPRP